MLHGTDWKCRVRPAPHPGGRELPAPRNEDFRRHPGWHRASGERGSSSSPMEGSPVAIVADPTRCASAPFDEPAGETSKTPSPATPAGKASCDRRILPYALNPVEPPDAANRTVDGPPNAPSATSPPMAHLFGGRRARVAARAARLQRRAVPRRCRAARGDHAPAVISAWRRGKPGSAPWSPRSSDKGPAASRRGPPLR